MIDDINVQLLLWINGHYSPSLDVIMYGASDRFIWIPFYALLLALFAKLYGKNIWIILVSVTLLILFCDQTANLGKDFFKELRPCHEPSLQELIHIVNGYCGGSFGYISSHAANSAGLLVFSTMLLNKRFKWIKYALLVYVLLICYSRIYLGAHYPMDIFRGLSVGVIFGFFIARASNVALKKVAQN